MNQKTLSDRYADVDPRRVREAPRDQLERDFADAEAMQEAKRIWDRFGRDENYRKRVIMLLAQEALRTLPSRNEQDFAKGLQDE